jgi:antitoxin VapB
VPSFGTPNRFVTPQIGISLNYCSKNTYALLQVEIRVAYTCVYAKKKGVNAMKRSAKVFMNNRNQAVRLPKDFQFNTREVFIRKEGRDVVLSPKPEDWSSYLTDGPVASYAFMEGVEDLPVQERKL